MSLRAQRSNLATRSLWVFTLATTAFLKMKEESSIQEAEKVFSETDATAVFKREASLEWVRKECQDAMRMIIEGNEASTVIPLKHMILSGLREHGHVIPEDQQDSFLWGILMRDIAFPAIYTMAYGSEETTEKCFNILAKSWGGKRDDVKMRLQSDYKRFCLEFLKSLSEKEK